VSFLKNRLPHSPKTALILKNQANWQPVQVFPVGGSHRFRQFFKFILLPYQISTRIKVCISAMNRIADGSRIFAGFGQVIASKQLS